MVAVVGRDVLAGEAATLPRPQAIVAVDAVVVVVAAVVACSGPTALQQAGLGFLLSAAAAAVAHTVVCATGHPAVRATVAAHADAGNGYYHTAVERLVLVVAATAQQLVVARLALVAGPLLGLVGTASIAHLVELAVGSLLGSVVVDSTAQLAETAVVETRDLIVGLQLGLQLVICVPFPCPVPVVAVPCCYLLLWVPIPFPDAVVSASVLLLAEKRLHHWIGIGTAFGPYSMLPPAKIPPHLCHSWPQDHHCLHHQHHPHCLPGHTASSQMMALLQMLMDR